MTPFTPSDSPRDLPAPRDLPSPRALVRASLMAVVVVSVLAITVVLPSESGTDPTGIGRALGLTAMGENKAAAAAQAAADASVEPLPPGFFATARADTLASDETRLTLPPGQGREVKLAMRAGASVRYAWTADRGTVAFDLHGDQGDRAGTGYQSYGAGGGAWSGQGVLTAAFDGRHGWFWRNDTAEPLTITLHTEGAYLALSRPD